MGELGTELREGVDDVRLNIPYEITDVEEMTTDVQQYQGVRVVLVSPKGHIGSVALWKRPVTTPRSKLGIFVKLLTSNTDKWLHKWVIFRAWERGNRNMELTTAPEGKGTKVKTTK